MNYMNYDLARNRMQDVARDAERRRQVNEAYRASKLAAARSASTSSWTVVKRVPTFLAAALRVGF